jgi:hypothetical protein
MEVERITHDAVTSPQPIHKPNRITGGNVGSAACADYHAVLPCNAHLTLVAHGFIPVNQSEKEEAMKLKKFSLLVLLAGGAMIASLVLLTSMSGGVTRPSEYPNNQGFTQAIIWFELLQSPEEVGHVLGDPSTNEGIRLRQVMDTVNRYDFLYMVWYPLLFIALIIFVHGLLVNKGYQLSYGRIVVIVGVVLSVGMFLGDVYENLQLFKISAYKSISDIKPEIITTLQIATRIKNVPIFLCSLIVAYFYILYFKKSWGLVLPVIYVVSALLGFVAITVGSARFLLEASYGLLAVGWIVSIVHSGVWYVRSRKSVGA